MAIPPSSAAHWRSARERDLGVRLGGFGDQVLDRNLAGRRAAPSLGGLDGGGANVADWNGAEHNWGVVFYPGVQP